MRLKFIFLALFGITGAQLFDYGERYGDQKLEYSHDLRAVAVDIPILFLESSHNELFLSSNGIIGLGEKLPDIPTPLSKMNRYTIAAYYAPVANGVVYYRSTTDDQTLLMKITGYIHTLFADSSEFRAVQAVMVTWDRVQNKEMDPPATFQVAIATDGQTSYVVIVYQALPWSSSAGIYAQAGFSGKDGVHQSSVNSGGPDVKELVNLSNNQEYNSFIYRVSGPAIEDPRENGDDYDYATYDSEYDSQDEPQNACPPDPYRDNCPAGCNILTDDRGCSLCVCAEGKRVEVPEYQPPHPKEPEQSAPAVTVPQPNGDACIAAGETACHAFGKCKVHDNGYCCYCEPGYYGNGKECLKKGDPQRISGFFEGVVNGKAIEKTDLHTFITATDGNAYTAVSKIPSDLGAPFLLLNPIGSVMGWLFAEVHSPLVYNGFQLTGGLFNRTVTLHIGDRYYLTIRQEFSGRDIYHYFKANVFVSGTLPDIAPGSEVVFPDYEEEYRRESAGFVRSYTGMNILVRENGQEKTMRMTVDQQIHYNECAFKTFDQEPVVVLHVKRVHVTYDSVDGIVRYGSRNYAHHPQTGKAVAPTGGHFNKDRTSAKNSAVVTDGVCAPGRHVCTLDHMRCRPWEETYRCECEPGFETHRDSESPLGWLCRDLNECDRGDHSCSPHATCTNTKGGFACICNPPYVGDGHTCLASGSSTVQHGVPLEQTSPVELQESQPHTEHHAGACTNHNQCHQYGECVFTSGNPVGSCKCRGWYTGDGAKHCGPPEEAQKPEQQNAHLERRGGKSCGKEVCDPNAECMPARNGESECVCRAGYAGNGLVCESLIYEEEEDQHKEVSDLGKVCRSHEECSEHGSCAYSHSLGYYQCVCTDPYHGNGIDCHLLTENVPAPPSVGNVAHSCDVMRDCHAHADCVFERTREGGKYKCVCQAGYMGDGKYCAKTQFGVMGALPPLEQPGCDQLKNCHANAQCVYDSHNRKYRCECHENFVGDGFNCVQISSGQPNWENREPAAHTCREQTDCHTNGHCVASGTGRDYHCECLPGYRGDGVNQCEVADQCNPADRGACHQNAQCVFGEKENAYVCQCVPGFSGPIANCVPDGPKSTCADTPRLCHANAQCVFNHDQNTHMCLCKPGSVGDGYSQCTVQDNPRCTNCSIHAHCSQNQQTGAYLCKCNVGYQGNGYICSRMTSCLHERAICDAHAECVPGEGGHYVCNCHYGFHGDGRICHADSEGRGDSLLVARGMAIFQRGTNAEIPGKQVIVIPHHIAVGIDFDCRSEKIVWSDISGHSIKIASLNGTRMKSYFAADLNSPEGIAVDWASKNVYYADSLNDEIGVASLNGKYKKSLVTEGLVNPRSVALDIRRKHLYYTDWHRENPLIGRVDMDGENNRIFVNEGIHLPNGLSVLPNRKELCWVDAGSHKLSCIGLDGNHRRDVFAPLEYPFGLCHDREERFYWTDWKDNRIHTVGVYGDNYNSFPISVGGSGKVYGIVAVPKTCEPVHSPCEDDNGGCKYLCLPSTSDDDAICACPDNVAVKGC